ncbi:MAG: GGDEF domain-containing protein [Clostridiales bacterium]|nr:GGDEF domain-containing protein [Clostridiales bacterium]
MTNIVATSAINILALVILSKMVFSNSVLIRGRKRPFFCAIVLSIIVILAEIGTIVAGEGGSAWRSLNMVSNVVGFMLTPFIPVVLLSIFDSKALKARLYLLLPALLNGIAAVLSPFFGLLFSIDAENRYSRGNLFIFFVAVYMFHLLLLVGLSLRKGRGHLYSIHWSIFSLTLFVVAGTVIQLVFPAVYSSWHIVTLALFLYYLLLSEHDGRLDFLTGLFNRSAFERDIGILKKSKRYTVIVLDLNDFKMVNDTLGHEYGDTVLKKVAAIIRESFDHECSCYRIGGDEFYVLCKCPDPEQIKRQLKSMTTRLAEERIQDSVLPTVAYGLSISQPDMPDFQALLKAADEEMYLYKQRQKEKKKSDEEMVLAIAGDE